MKIAFVVHDYSRTVGHGRYTVELASRFRHEHEVHVFSNTADPAETAGIRMHHVPALRWNALTTVLTFPGPATLQLGGDWDIIHAQGACCARFNVITAHICNAGWALAQRRAAVARTWRQRTFERLVTGFERATYRNSPRAEVIAISGALRTELEAFYGRTERVAVIHHGVDPETFAPASPDERAALRRTLSLPTGRPLALFVGDLRKGAAAALAVAARVPEIGLVLVSRSDPAPYVAHAKELGVLDRVTFRSATGGIEDAYRAADMFLFPSPYDAFGMVISEAMACGMPVITARQAGASELIVHGESGFVVGDAYDIDAMATHVSMLAHDERRRTRIGAAARTVAARHTWDSVARLTMEVYQRATPLR